METRYLQTLIMVVETGSFSKAAELLHITQSAASQRIKWLEERCGQSLIDRSGSALSATPAGDLVIAKSRDILDLERELFDSLTRLDGEKRLSVCCTPTFGMAFLPMVINDFMLGNADLIDFKFIFQQPDVALRGLADNQFDLAIIEHCYACDLSAFDTHQLPDDELVFISAPQLQLPSSPAALQDLLSFRLFARREGCSSRELLQRNLLTAGEDIASFKSLIVSDDLRLTIQNVVAGGGISFVSRALVAAQLADGSLRACHVEGFDHFRSRTVVVPRNRQAEPVLRSFLDCLFQRIPPCTP
ncbi:MAG: LysR family transcriptional regulator [Desulfuromonadales bacterium GWD2_61_12]|nr:MAG: LysR family transcriptional regulator [Desulfuromonadales bacterium GWC2_61_20]OGR32915.1 MAG: LysR family transcriptional regulator [Desulfuromonadales bacterium GWD2_61_12]HAD05186.1 LysR family transcriptional regulator [Desulfuromonas sp.]HBT84262.1 LysR family transcriptional regulator [Desulfuromonas sp.]